MKKTEIAFATALALGLSTFSASALAVTYTQSNFTMLGAAGLLVGGTNDITATWDGTFNTAATDTNFNMTISSPTTFFGGLWKAYSIRVFAPGTYTISTADTLGGTGCPTAATPGNCYSGGNYTVTVPTDQIMAHMKFAWNGSEGIDVINVWQKNAVFAPSKMCVTGMIGFEPSDPTLGVCGTSTSRGENPANTVWDLMSTDVDGNGVNGIGMIDGPFGGFNANFNLKAVPVPAAVWLFGSGLMGFMALARRKKPIAN